MLTQSWLNSVIIKSVVALVLLTTLSSCDYITKKILYKPVVQVEQLSLSTQNFSKELAYRLKDLDALSAKDPKIVDYYKNQIINDFVVASVIDLWFQENKFMLSKSEVEKEISSLVAAYPTKADFQVLLSESGMGYAEWVVKVEKDLKKKKLISLLSKSLPQENENELLVYYNNNRLKYEQVESILLSHIHVNDLNEAAIAKKLLSKEKFTAVAQKYSKSYSQEAKDLYGWVEKSFSPEFEKAFKKRAGEVFGPVTLSDGIHIFKVIQRRPNKVLTFAEVRPQITAEIRSLREKAKFTAWLDEQIKKYKIRKNLGIIDSIRVETQ